MASNGITTTGNSAPMPEFSHPPVVEVALSIQFEPLAGFRVAHFGLFWAQIRDRFPKAQEQPALPPTVERFGARVQVPQLQFSVGVISPRCWFLDRDETELLQLQSDRVIHNWRKLDRESAPYPHYGTLRDKLRQEFSAFAQFVERENIGKAVPNQCELTYINHIFLDSKAGDQPDVTKVIAPWQGRYSDSFLKTPASLNATLSFVIPGAAGPAGRLYITVAPSLRASDNRPLIVLQTICRGAPDGPDSEGAFRFLDQAHEWAVRGFASITTPDMHSRWGRAR
jgi:uncharacterized protein (TIGR04255 family)